MLILVYPDERPGEASGQGISGFLRQLNKAVPAGSGLHVIPDNSGTHKTAEVISWPKVHPRCLLHLTPTSEPGWTRLQAGSVRWSAEPAKVAYSQLPRISGMRYSASSGSTTTELPGPAHGQKMQRSWLKSSQNERTTIAHTRQWSWSDRIRPTFEEVVPEHCRS